MNVRPRPLLRSATVAVLVIAMSLATAGGVRGEVDSGVPSTASLTDNGWWNRAKGAQEGEPPNPLRSNLGNAVPAPTTVPDNGLGVGAVGGDPDKVAAVGITLDAPADAVVDTLTLTLVETTQSGSNVNTAGARIAACPITEFWAGVKNGDWVNRPTCDESQAVAGERAGDGTWTFDLTLLAMQWIDPSSGLAPNGVLLVEAVDRPVSFQVSLADISTGEPVLDFSATTFETDRGDDFAAGEDDFVAGGDGGGGGFESPGFDPNFDVSPSFGPTMTSPVTPVVPGPQRVPPQTGRPSSAVSPGPLPSPFDNIPVVAAIAFLLMLAGAALVVAFILGPRAALSPAAAIRRGGVSRALAAREAASRN